MKNNMSALDIRICLSELKDLIGAWTGKVYEIDGTFLLKFNPPEKERKELVIEPGRRIHLTEMKYSTPDHPPSFPMLLRKHLTNTKLTEINQPDMERIVELTFEKKDKQLILIAELFGSGNLILCKENREIIAPYRSESWKHREIKSGQKYRYPPKKGKNISSVSRDDLKEALSEEPDIVRGMARNLNIGGPLAEEICARANLAKETSPKELSDSDYKDLQSAISELLSAEVSPRIIYDKEKPIDFIPFSFKSKKNQETEIFESFNSALDNYFQKISKQRTESKGKERLEEKLETVKSRLEKQKNHLQELEAKAQETKKEADAISTRHKKIDYTLEKLRGIQETEGWEEVEEEIQKSPETREKWAKPIESIQPSEGTIIINLPETPVSLDFRFSSFENASRLYEEYKSAKGKMEGAKKAIEETEKELDEIREKGVKPSEKPAPKKLREKEWYERYRWCRSSEGLLIIAGRDTKTNQEIVEKHMEPSDLYLHADLKGAPHTVIKGKKEKISTSTIEEAAKFAAMHSRAWRRGLANADVYWVKPEQVTKEAPAGEYLPTGSYMIKGERNYLTVPLEAAIGIWKKDGTEIPMCGPPSAIDSHSDFLIKIKPGPEKKSGIAQKIKEILQDKTGREIDLDELMQILPPGSGTLEI
ncbi:hypothetical protein AKJ54_00425 [candidate division MSBL1 archaeon SCGC-AAA382K21]|uniref:NFACT RNA-binding domain-containing protein n=1 Tax=candidate division MSBL1 archaeon SCGC-AAA382K21 TaxID=1698283 RepID=A0A133VLI6_9EURY|nr:hypothetical protein AKJ54_00425 [candidate division MSBL1 archaeon SCGC-AAA382K21]